MASRHHKAASQMDSHRWPVLLAKFWGLNYSCLAPRYKRFPDCLEARPAAPVDKVGARAPGWAQSSHWWPRFPARRRVAQAVPPPSRLSTLPKRTTLDLLAFHAPVHYNTGLKFLICKYLEQLSYLNALCNCFEIYDFILPVQIAVVVFVRALNS